MSTKFQDIVSKENRRTHAIGIMMGRDEHVFFIRCAVGEAPFKLTSLFDQSLDIFQRGSDFFFLFCREKGGERGGQVQFAYTGLSELGNGDRVLPLSWKFSMFLVIG